ncbi:LytTR family DNA-binding domain-containing protein [Aeromicrobium sp. Leaf350]|uniref:LytR/AlgR family response regulator transcription factor n=1 Tax=Aeromicrobium sp. Leaf350 TaxID=2876565 RepID=UPI001E561503|nr:LytTR family DNA-binding domain-containing protein [Aeromicrobium sp. Leaf350]
MNDRTAPPALRVLVVDDERPVLDELVWLLARDERIAHVRTASSGTEALRVLEGGDVDLAFLDIAMPGLSGLEIARLLGRFAHPPQVVFVTAHDAHAIEAFEMNAVDYLLKPVREERLAESIRRAVDAGDRVPAAPDERIAVELGGVTRFVMRSTITDVEAQGDYVRLHTIDGTSHLVRMTLSHVADTWAEHDFARVHRSHVVNRRHIREVRQSGGRTTLVLPSGDATLEVEVSRRHHRDLRELIRDA